MMYWMIPVVTAIAWLIVGAQRASNPWIYWIFTITWALNIMCALVIGYVKIAP